MRLSSSMRKNSRILFSLLTAALFLQFGCGQKEDTAGTPRFEVEQTARVKYVIDGDTLETKDGERIRFLGIDTPEIKKRTEEPPDQPWGRDAANFVTLLLPPGTEIGLGFEAGPREGAYGRTLAYVILDGEVINALLLQEGYGRYKDYGNVLKHGEYLKRMESQAKVYGKGLWEGKGRLPTPKYYVAGKNSSQYHDPDSYAARQIRPHNLVRLTKESAQKVGLKPGRTVQ